MPDTSHPSKLRAWLDTLRQDFAHNHGVAIPFDARTSALAVVICVLLTLFYYFARPSFYHSNLAGDVERVLGMTQSPWRGLLPYYYWALSSTTLRLLIPAACIIFWFKEPLGDYGFQRWKRGHAKIYAGFYALMFPLLAAVSFLPSFQSKYPFYKAAASSWQQFIAYELALGVQFAALEGFFRGFIIFALFKRFGYHAITIMTIPYCMIHFGKPLPETLGSIVAGFALGYMAIKSRSWLPGALLHWSIGLTLDVLVIMHRGGFGAA